MSQRRRTRRAFGAIRKLPSGRYQASYTDPQGQRRNAPTTFYAKIDADAWLSDQRRTMERGAWRGTDDKITVGEYSEAWLAGLRLGPRTVYNYRASYRRWIEGTFAATPMAAVTTPMVRKWLGIFPNDKPAARVQAYRTLARIFNEAVSDGIISESPVRVAGASQYRRQRDGHALTIPEVFGLTEHMPDRLKLVVPLAAFSALRPGEALGLRRRDVNVSAGLVHIRETASARIDGYSVGKPKTESSARTVHYPRELDEALLHHLDDHASPGKSGHLFPRKGHPDEPIPYATFAGAFRRAVKSAGLEDVRPHDLRHSGATLAAATGATVRELMARLGHTSPAVAMGYQHSARERDRAIADALGESLSSHMNAEE